MLPKNVVDTVIKHVKELDTSRKALQGLSAEILSASKRAIFAFHRGDENVANEELATAREKLAKGTEMVKKESRLACEGMWRACQEEFCEASLLAQYLATRKVGRVTEIADDPELFLGGLSDFTGELVRRAVLVASERDREQVERIFEDVRETIDFLLRMDLTGTLRTKLDQAKQNLRKLEEIRYELAIRA